MHYGVYDFAIDRKKPTIILPAGKTLTGQTGFMSDVSNKYVALRKGGDQITNPFLNVCPMQIDALEINKYYNCAAFLG